MRITISLIVLLISFSATAQNRVNYSQYMHNHQIFNPAYIDQTNNIGGSVLYRNQWMGIDGTPQSFIGDVYYGFRGHNFNLQFLYDQITVFKHLEIGGSYSYAIKLGRNTQMAFGMKASFNQQTANYDQLTFYDGVDPQMGGTVKNIGVNFGAGMFVRSKHWHVGFGAPYILNNEVIDQNDKLFNSFQYQHFFLTGGYRFVDDYYFKFYPTAMIKWTKGAPLAASIDMNFLLSERFWLSGGYRIDNTIILSAGIILWKDFKIIYSYDLGLGKVNRFGGMTHELSLGYGVSMYRNSFVKRKFVKRNGWRKKIRRSRWK
ncbi:PorP/SprF family type IX secretion system membrane protein [Paracrocinitomix mangrovi]|uniref:PorP/SprF family type IX secretion system membrane protein n=1 Tax=Paracrocinitomix mangrovi TaxID=2862509 RepID=UPI001C8ECA22|nr:PorP/SprF family type IX secretion system membrane protein [Paracrocinitomix mangrovi]UKN00094.1 PorP/SprF family type IX secretion system membrane protein [Paracrocinitomix mangrovi]